MQNTCSQLLYHRVLFWMTVIYILYERVFVPFYTYTIYTIYRDRDTIIYIQGCPFSFVLQPMLCCMDEYVYNRVNYTTCTTALSIWFEMLLNCIYNWVCVYVCSVVYNAFCLKIINTVCWNVFQLHTVLIMHCIYGTHAF